MDYTFVITIGVGLAQVLLSYMQYRIMKSTIVPTEQSASPSSFLKRYWPICAMALLMVGNWVPYLFFRAPQQPQRMPNIVRAWGTTANGCYAAIDTSWLVKFREKERLFLICIPDDPNIDSAEDTKMAISKPFQITGGLVRISITYDSASEIKQFVKPGVLVWQTVATLPKDQDGSKIKTISDVKRHGGQIFAPGTVLK